MNTWDIHNSPAFRIQIKDFSEFSVYGTTLYAENKVKVYTYRKLETGLLFVVELFYKYDLVPNRNDCFVKLFI